MRKILACALAAVGMVACVNEDVVQLPKSDAIRFADAFIDNSTRAAVDPSTTKESLTAFDVWAYMTSTEGTVLVGEDVQFNETTSSWDYANVQYWTPEKDYFFAALAPMNSNNWSLTTEGEAVFGEGAGLVTFENIEGGEDLIYATANVTTPDMTTLQDKGMETVKFQFQHLLSKVKFTFKNGFLTDNATIKIDDITMTAPKSGKVDLGEGTVDQNGDKHYDWVLDNEDLTLAFGNVEELIKNKKSDECAFERLTIPADETYTYNIKFTVTLKYGNEVAYKVDKESTVTGVALEMGKAYNFVAEINPDNLNLPAIVFEVEGVDAWEDPYIDVEHPVVATINNVPYTSLQAAVDAATGDTTIEVVSPVKETVTVTQANGVNLVINGNGNEFNGTLRVSGRSNDNGTETLVIDGFKFKANTKEVPCVDMYWGTSNDTRYAHNVTVSNCTFTMVGAAIHTSPAIDCYQPYNLTVKDCEVSNAHSLLQVKGGHNGVAVENVKVVDCKNGIAFGTHDGPVSVKNAEINTIGYGIRADGSVATTLTVENAKIDALRPIVVRKTTGNYNVALVGTNVFTAGDYYQVIFTKGNDDVTYVAPTGAYTITGADDFKVYPVDASDRVSSAAELTAKLADANVSEIALESGAVIEGTFAVKRPVTIKSFEGNKATIKGRVEMLNCNASFTNVKFDYNDTSKTEFSNNIKGNPAGHPAIIGVYGGVGNSATFEDCEFNFLSGYSIAKAPGAITHYGDIKLKITNCTLTGTGNPIYAKTNVEMVGCTVSMNGNNAVLSLNYTESARVIFKNNTLINTGSGSMYAMQMLSTNGKIYSNMYFDIQGNTGVDVICVGNATFPDVTFAPGSETF